MKRRPISCSTAKPGNAAIVNMSPKPRSAMPKARLTRRAKRDQRGFTLLEVMVALTITGMALGSLFSIIGGNKQLAWRSEEALREANGARLIINYSQLNDTRGNVDLDFGDSLLLSTGGEFDVPERKTEPTRYAIRQYEVIDETGETLAQGSYWVELDFPE